MATKMNTTRACMTHGGWGRHKGFKSTSKFELRSTLKSVKIKPKPRIPGVGPHLHGVTGRLGELDQQARLDLLEFGVDSGRGVRELLGRQLRRDKVQFLDDLGAGVQVGLVADLK